MKTKTKKTIKKAVKKVVKKTRKELNKFNREVAEQLFGDILGDDKESDYQEIEIGVVGVDSGQIMICDPCYVNSQWKEEELVMTPATILFPDGHKEEVEHISKRWFELIDRVNKGELKIIKNSGFAKAKNNFSYPACVNATNDLGYGQLNFALGHAGVGVVSSSGYGDGLYPVIAKLNKKTGRIKELKVEFF